MKKPLFAFLATLAMLFVPACGGGGAAGTYELDKTEMKKAMMADMPAGDAGKAQAAMMEKMMDSMQMSFELKADGTAAATIKMMGMDESGTGSWKLDGKKISMTMKGKDGKEETKVGDYENGTITVNEDGKKVLLRRK